MQSEILQQNVQAVGGGVEVLIKFRVVDQFPGRTLTGIDLLQGGIQVVQGGLNFRQGFFKIECRQFCVSTPAFDITRLMESFC